MKIKLLVKRMIQLGLIILLSFIIYSNLRVKGVWMGVYEGNESSFFNTNNEVLVFKNFNFDKICELYSCNDIKNKFLFAFGNNIFFDEKDEYIIKWKNINYLGNDSLVFKTYNGLSVYRKIPDSLKQKESFKTNFKNKLLTINNDEFKDTIYINDKYLLFKNNKHPNQKWSDDYYEIKNIEDFKIMYFNNSIQPIIIKEKNNKITFFQYGRNKINSLKVEIIKSNHLINEEIKKKIKRLKKIEEIERARDSVPTHFIKLN
jgi:hypothetical protein